METKTNKEKNITVELTHEDVLNLIEGFGWPTNVYFYKRKQYGEPICGRDYYEGWKWNRNRLKKFSTEYLWYLYQCLVKNELPKY